MRMTAGAEALSEDQSAELERVPPKPRHAVGQLTTGELTTGELARERSRLEAALMRPFPRTSRLCCRGDLRRCWPSRTSAAASGRPIRPPPRRPWLPSLPTGRPRLPARPAASRCAARADTDRCFPALREWHVQCGSGSGPREGSGQSAGTATSRFTRVLPAKRTALVRRRDGKFPGVVIRRPALQGRRLSLDSGEQHGDAIPVADRPRAPHLEQPGQT